jgi:hypothetical protein
LVLSLVILLGLVWLYGLVIRPRSASGLPPWALTENLEHLRKHVETPQFTYAQRMIRTRHFTGEREDLTVVEAALFPPAVTLEKIGDGEQHKAGGTSIGSRVPDRLPPLDLYVPESPKVNTSVMSFGVATTVSRLKDATSQLLHWLPRTGCPLHVISPPNDNTFAMQSRMRDLGINTTIVTSKSSYAIAYFSLIKEVYDNRLPHTQWLVLIDDDTFIPSLPTLVDHLSTNYNPAKQVMVTAMSDNIDQIHEWGVQPFGGGGIFISIPLAARLTSPEIWDKCADGMGHGQGDQIISRCLNHFTDVRPKFDGGLNQMDIQGSGDSAAGYFESGRRMLTIHHWRTWFRVDVPMGALVSKACGYEGVFQRWSFPSANMVLSNGFSIVEYPEGLDKINLAAVEMTWQGEEANFLHKIGPLRKVLGEEKVSYKLVASEVVDKWFVRQVYVHQGKEKQNEEREMDGVLELLWLL